MQYQRFDIEKVANNSLPPSQGIIKYPMFVKRVFIERMDTSLQK